MRAAIVIAGGGVVGLSLAYALARRGEDVLVLERDRVGAGAGGVAAGMLAPSGEAEHVTPELLALIRESHRLYPEWVETLERESGLPCGLRREGTLLAALTRDDEDEIGRLAAFQERLGLGGDWLTTDQALELEPNLTPRLTGALHLPHDWQVDPQAMLAALERALTERGGRLLTGATVTGFETQGGRLTHVSFEKDGERQTVACDTAVLAAGAWSGREMAWPAGSPGIRPVKGQLLHLTGPELVHHVVRSPDVYVVPRAGGRLVVGATMEEQGFDASATAGAVMDLLWNARRLVPGIYELALADVRVGFRPATSDHLPLIGPTEVPGLWVATGHFRHGVLLAPVTATLLAEALTGGTTSPLLAPFGVRQGAGAGVSGAPGVARGAGVRERAEVNG